MKIKGLKVLNLLLEINYLLIIFLIPITFFFFWFPTNNSFELNKIVVFNILTLLLLFLSLIKIIFFSSFTLKTLGQKLWVYRKYWLTPIIFITALAISVLFSVSPVRSFFGDYYRQMGFVNYLYYFLWYILLIFNIKAISQGSVKKRIERIVLVIVFSSFLTSLYGILQALHLDFFTWKEMGRSFSSFGQPNYFATFIVLTFPFTIYLFIIYKKFLIRFGLILISLFQFIALLTTLSRSGILSFIITFFIFLIYFFWFKEKFDYKKRIIVVLSFFLVIISIVSFLIIVDSNRLYKLKSGSIVSRINIYENAIKGIVKKPIFGYGLENQGSSFINYYQPDWGVRDSVGVIPTRAHNFILDILLTTGLWGLVFYILFYYFFFSLGIENIRKKKNEYLSLTIIFSAIAYFIAISFNFSIITTEVYFWLLLALLVVLNIEQIEFRFKYKFSWKRLSLIILFGIGIIFLMIGSSNKLIADYYFYHLKINLAQGDFPTVFVLDDYIREQKVNIVQQQEYDVFLGNILSNSYYNLQDRVTQKLAYDKLKVIKDELDDNYYSNLLTKGKVVSVVDGMDKARGYFLKMISLSPEWSRSYFEFAYSLQNNKIYNQALVNYGLVLNTLPSLDSKDLNDDHRQQIKFNLYSVYKNMAKIYQEKGKYKEAIDYYKLAYQQQSADYTLLKNIADNYYLSGDIKTAIIFNKRGLMRSPRDYVWPFSLSILYNKLGDEKNKEMYFNQALKLNSQLIFPKENK